MSSDSNAILRQSAARTRTMVSIKATEGVTAMMTRSLCHAQNSPENLQFWLPVRALRRKNARSFLDNVQQGITHNFSPSLNKNTSKFISC